jgi:hypothetical protein
VRKFTEQKCAVIEEWVSNNSNDWQGPFTSEAKDQIYGLLVTLNMHCMNYV